MRTEAEIWERFMEIKGWEHFDPDLDNVGGADSMSEQALSVILRFEARYPQAAR